MAEFPAREDGIVLDSDAHLIEVGQTQLTG
jgi:hypothetical protein